MTTLGRLDGSEPSPVRCSASESRRNTRRKLIGWCGWALLAPAAPAAAQPTPWLLTVHVGESYSSNVRLRAPGNDRQPKGFVTSAGAGLGHTFLGRDSNVNVGVHANTVFFDKLGQLNRLNSSAHVGYSRPLSSSSSVSMSDQFANSYNTMLDDLANEGVLLPLAGTKRNHAEFDFDHRISERTTMGFGMRHDLFFFRNDPDADEDLIDGWRFGSNLHFGREFGPGQSGSLSFGYSRNGRSANIPNVFSTGVGWGQALGPRLGVHGEIGASTARSATRSTTRLTGSASFSWKLQNGSIHGAYRRSMGLGIGLGRVTSRESFSFGMNKTLWRRVGVSIGGRQVSNGDPFDALFEHDAQSVHVGVRMPLPLSMALGTKYTFVRRPRGGEEIKSHRVGVAISYHTSF